MKSAIQKFCVTVLCLCVFLPQASFAHFANPAENTMDFSSFALQPISSQSVWQCSRCGRIKRLPAGKFPHRGICTANGYMGHIWNRLQ